MESGGISRVIDFLAKRPELDQWYGKDQLYLRKVT